MDDFRRLQERARETINNWPEYKRMSIIRDGRIVPWTPPDGGRPSEPSQPRPSEPGSQTRRR
jgi:hypothetical protein